MNKAIFSFLCAFIFLGNVFQSRAQLVVYAADTANSLNYDTLAPNATASTSLSYGSGIKLSSSNCYYGITTTGSGYLSASLDANTYFSFTVKPSACHKLSVTGLSASMRRSNLGPDSAQIYYSLDSGATWTKSKVISVPYSACITASNRSGDWKFATAIDVTDVQKGIIFKIYAWGAPKAGGNFQLFDVRVDGSVVALSAIGGAGKNQVICKGSTATLGDAAISGNTYSWTSKPTGFTSTLSNPVVSPITTTTYFLAVSNTSGCKANDSTVVTFHTASISFLYSPDNNYKTTFTPSDSLFASYLWSFGDGNSSASVKPVHQYKAWGTYPVMLKVTDQFGCTYGDSQSVNLVVTSINQNKGNTSNILVSPNPFSDKIVVSFGADRYYTISLFNLTGELVASNLPNEMLGNSKRVELKTSQLSPGVYILKVVSGSDIFTYKVVKE